MKFRLHARPTHIEPARAVRFAPAPLTIKSRPLRVLDFDVEARPLHWISGDYVSKEITAIAWAWTDQPADVTCVLLGEMPPEDMLLMFCMAYDRADVVTGHYIRGYDLPMINGALTEYQLPTLSEKMTHDTKIDLVIRQGLSGSQENLGAMLGLVNPKVKMDQAKWRDANRLTPEGRLLARERVIGDVRQHIEMRQRMLELGYLSPPKRWKPGTAKAEAYTP
jgi:hypothetical protein